MFKKNYKRHSCVIIFLRLSLILYAFGQVRGRVRTFPKVVIIGRCNVLRISKRRGANTNHKLFISLFHYMCCFCSLKNHIVSYSFPRLTLYEMISFLVPLYLWSYLFALCDGNCFHSIWSDIRHLGLRRPLTI